MKDNMRIMIAEVDDISELYNLQLVAFESEAEMIGSREVPALQETIEENRKDFANWTVLKLVNKSNEIVGAIRFKRNKDVLEVGRLMVHPNYRGQGLAKHLIEKVDIEYPNEIKELYTCTKSYINIKLYKKKGYTSYKEVLGDQGLSFVYMRKI